MSILRSKSAKRAPEYINNIMDKKALNNLLSQVFLEYGSAKTSYLANALKDLGFKYATKAGTTISISDLVVPPVKKELLKKAEDEIDKATHRYLKGEITEVERYTKVIDTWSETTELLTKAVVENFDKLNPVYMMAFSGARGNLSQVSQLVGMRGLMADAQGQIIDLPIKANFREGLNVTEYIISSYGARKGLVDTALKTADSGYLTRRLVDVAQDVIIREPDCHTSKGIVMGHITEGDKIMVELGDRLLGRTIAEDIVDADGNVICKADETLDRKAVASVTAAGIDKVKVRSPLTCALEYGICQKCYGWALTSNKVVDIGEAIGIIAAQSIGEPGTQLTMRTFHTGGVFRGSSNIQKVYSKIAGKIVKLVQTRDFRTRHGDLVDISTKEGKMEIKDAKGLVTSFNIPQGATVFKKLGDEVIVGDLISEFEPGAVRGDASRLTEKATKDIQSALSGKILFDGFSVDEKRDRQGNISRSANRAGIIWILAGDVYPLPGGSKILVKDEEVVPRGKILAETTTLSEHGGEVRLGDELEIENDVIDGRTITKIVNGKEITIVIASLVPENAVLEDTKREQLWRVNETGETYVLKSPVGTVVENGMIIAELLDEENKVESSGEVRYAGIEVDENHIVTTPGTVYFIPEELHQLSKDLTLKLVESGSYVTAGTEVVKDVRVGIDGLVEIKEFNDIIHEVIVRPGQLHKLDSASLLKVEDGDIVEAGTEIAPGIVISEKSMVTVLSTLSSPSGDFQLDDIEEEEEEFDSDDVELELGDVKIEILVRPVQEFEITPKEVAIKFSSTEGELIDMAPVTQMQYRDGARVRNADGASLTRTSLVLSMQGYLSHLKAMVEFVGEGEERNIKIVVLENLIVRREVEDQTRGKASVQTELLVEQGQLIDPKTPVSKIQVLAKNDGKVSLNQPTDVDVRRLLLICDDSNVNVPIKTNAVVKSGDLIKMDQIITEGGELSKMSGQVVQIKDKEIIVRTGRPYLISAGTQLQVDSNSLVQRGDLLATLIFERQKTGDIVQGLPRVEELLEARKPKEAAILAEEDGISEFENEDDFEKLYLLTDYGRQEIKMPMDANIIVMDKQKIIKGQPLTDGPLNPHDVMRLSGNEAVQQYLVEEVQRVYRSQGVDIADKHIEVIVRQMSKKVKIEEPGDTKLLPGELLELHIVEQEDKAVQDLGGKPCEYSSVLLGITKASLNTESFISAASFQETTRVLTEAAVEGKKDLLRGLKENVIIGRLIPAGTGFYHLTHTAEGKAEEKARGFARGNARKPSAILEEIEGMFGSPDFTLE